VRRPCVTREPGFHHHQGLVIASGGARISITPPSRAWSSSSSHDVDLLRYSTEPLAHPAYPLSEQSRVVQDEEPGGDPPTSALSNFTPPSRGTKPCGSRPSRWSTPDRMAPVHRSSATRACLPADRAPRSRLLTVLISMAGHPTQVLARDRRGVTAIAPSPGPAASVPAAGGRDRHPRTSTPERRRKIRRVSISRYQIRDRCGPELAARRMKYRKWTNRFSEKIMLKQKAKRLMIQL